MSPFTLQEAQDQLKNYMAAEAAVLRNQSYEIAGRKVTRAHLNFVQEGVKLWADRVTALSNKSVGRTRCRTIIAGG